MAGTSKAKASDKAGIVKKLVTILKKRYKSPIPKNDRPILETMLYAVCLENASPEQAEIGYARLHTDFHDLNEVRVSSISELLTPFTGMSQPERRAQQVRAVLHYVFEKQFGFEFEALRKKTLELATKQLGKIKDISPFVRAFTLQEALGSHTVPLDDQMTRAAIWMGLADAGSDTEQASNALKPVVRKPETAQFCHLLRCFASDPKMQDELDFAKNPPPEEGFDLGSAPARLQELVDRAEHGGRKGSASRDGRGSAAKAKSSKGAVKAKTGAGAKSASGSKTGSGRKTGSGKTGGGKTGSGKTGKKSRSTAS